MFLLIWKITVVFSEIISQVADFVFRFSLGYEHKTEGEQRMLIYSFMYRLTQLQGNVICTIYNITFMYIFFISLCKGTENSCSCIFINFDKFISRKTRAFVATVHFVLNGAKVEIKASMHCLLTRELIRPH